MEKQNNKMFRKRRKYIKDKIILLKDSLQLNFKRTERNFRKRECRKKVMFLNLLNLLRVDEV